MGLIKTKSLSVILMAVVIFLLHVLVSCSDSDEDAPTYTVSYISGDYSIGNTNELVLTVNGEASTAENAVVEVMSSDSKKAEFILKNIVLTNKSLTIKDVILNIEENKGFTFSGRYVGSKTKFSYSGTLFYPVLTLDIVME